jgi:hypothetical protein
MRLAVTPFAAAGPRRAPGGVQRRAAPSTLAGWAAASGWGSLLSQAQAKATPTLNTRNKDISMRTTRRKAAMAGLTFLQQKQQQQRTGRSAAGIVTAAGACSEGLKIAICMPM